MTPEELVRLGKSVFGADWKKPTARVIGRVPKMVLRYEAGEVRIPADVADRLRELAAIEPAGLVIKQLIEAMLATLTPSSRRSLGPGMPGRIHNLAKEIVDELRSAGHLRPGISKAP